MFPISSNSDSDSKLYVDDVFSTYLYTGNGSTQTITNGIDLAGKGGMVWAKNRNIAQNHNLQDTQVGITNRLIPNLTVASAAVGDISSVTASGFVLTNIGNQINTSGSLYASWTFRKAAKFFDVVTYTGTGTVGLTLKHNLGVAPGMVIIKCTSSPYSWIVWHKSFVTALPTDYLFLENVGTKGFQGQYNFWNSTPPTETQFTVGDQVSVNSSGQTYVAYLFAHDTAADGIIQCGSFTTPSTTGTASINLGYEPQFLITKRTDVDEFWRIIDVMRGMSQTGYSSLYPNLSDAEYTSSQFLTPTATGFDVSTGAFGTSRTYIYMAIRRPNKPPTSGTQVYNAFLSNTANPGGVPKFLSNFPVDMFMFGPNIDSANDRSLHPRLTQGKGLTTSSTAVEEGASNYSSSLRWDYNIGVHDNDGFNPVTPDMGWMFKRAPGFFDVVAFPASGVNQFYNHNLGVAPEFIILKCRNSPGDWFCRNVYVSGLLYLNATNAVRTDGLGEAIFGNGTTYVAPTNSQFYGGGWISSSLNMVAYLFATLSGISKVGSYTGNGSSQNIDCGFGSRYSVFVLIKRTDSTGDWYVWDTARGITTSIDPHLSLNTATAEVSTTNSIDLVSSGFTVIQNSTTNINVTNATYIYLSIASSVSYLTGGEALFTTPGTFYWTCPAGVTEACVVCIGAGGGTGSAYGLGNSSGAGGSLNYLNNYAVTPGQVYTVVVGDRAVSGGIAGSSSCFGITAGGGGSETNRGANVGGTAFNGGNAGGGGGGAGGYTGPGGVGGGQLNDSQTPRNGQGLGAGGGGGGGGANTGSSNAGGGGASLYGGAGGNGGFSNYNTAGNGGAAASTTTNNGEHGKSGVGYGGGNGGKYGGGGGALNISGSGDVSGIGGTGAVRIMWGSGRSFPYSAG